MKQMTGIVISTKMNNTALVEVTRMWKHPLYKKVVKRTKNYACDTSSVKVKQGDKVNIVEIRPISKTKHFKVESVMK